MSPLQKKCPLKFISGHLSCHTDVVTPNAYDETTCIDFLLKLKHNVFCVREIPLVVNHTEVSTLEGSCFDQFSELFYPRLVNAGMRKKQVLTSLDMFP